MSPDLYDAYRTAGDRLHAIADWYLLQIVVCGIAATIWRLAARTRRWCTVRHARRGLRHLESYANNRHTRHLLDEINQPRKETP